MAAGDQYRTKAAEFHARAQSEASPQIRVEFENLAKAHLRLAEQADWSERVEAVYDLCRQVRADAKSKSGLYEPPRPRSQFRPNKLPQLKSGGEECPRVQTSVRLREASRFSRPCWL
jgi:hypothetical protein